MAEGVRYIKVSKIDGEGIDNTNTLSSLTELTIPWSSGNITYDILTVTEFPSYFLYYVENPNIEHADRATPLYEFSGDLPDSILGRGGDGISNQPLQRKLKFGDIGVSIDNLDFLEEIAAGVDDNIYSYTQYKIRTYPQKDLNVRAVGQVTLQRNTSENHMLQLVKSNNGSTNVLVSDQFSGAGVHEFDMGITISSASLAPNDTITFTIANVTSPFYQAVKAAFTPTYAGLGPSIKISSSLATGPIATLVAEPYFSEDFSTALDCQPLLNNAILNSVNSQFQEVDYNDGMFIPSNQQLILDNQAVRAQVQDSNYSSFRHILPRYNGSRSTSQLLNTWSPPNTITGYEDVGTFGKIPSVSTLRTIAAYASLISGYTPELMNSSAVVIKYLINENGDLITPNQSPNSLEDNQNTFLPGEKVIINVPTTVGSTETQYRTILHGGKRIEPILYTQLGHSPAAWTSSINFNTNFITSEAVGNYLATSITSFPPDGGYTDNNQSKLILNSLLLGGIFNNGIIPSNLAVFHKMPDSTTDNSVPSFPGSGLNMNNNIFIGADAEAWSSNAYTIGTDVILENISLTFFTDIDVYLTPFTLGSQNHNIFLRLFKESTDGTKVVIASKTLISNPGNFTSHIALNYASLEVTLNSNDMSAGDVVYLTGIHSTSTVPEDGYQGTNYNAGWNCIYGNGIFRVTQNPSPTDTLVTSSGVNTIWGYPDSAKLYAITCSNNPLTSLYDSNFFQEDLPNSGFNKITIPWSVKYGDEFRFEGDEQTSFMVKKVYDVGDYDIDRVSSTGSIEIQFGSPGKKLGGPGINDLLPSQSINLDHFLIRRYIDDASSYIIEGFKPTLGEAPFVTIPEYSTQLLNENLPIAIQNLEENGLGFPIT